MQREINQLRKENGVLRESNLASMEVLDALRSHRDVPRILKLLQDHKDLVDIADIASISQCTPSRIGPTPAIKAIKEELCGSSSIQQGFELTSISAENWTSTPENQLLMKHLLSLYWTWIHPARPLLDMILLLQRLMAGTEEHASLFLVAAICAAACDLLSPSWTETLVVDSDIAKLKRSFIVEANRQEALAEVSAPTTLEALQVMRIVENRCMQAGPTSGFCSMELNQQLIPPEVESQNILRWLESIDSPVS